MTLSLRRLCHNILALGFGLFLLIASVTGLVLGFEPILEDIAAAKVTSSESIAVADVLAVLMDKTDEVFSIEHDASGSLRASLFIDDVERQVFINPRTGEILSDIPLPSPLFDFCRSLHRSLFLKSTGRIMMGLTALALMFLIISGLLLLLQKVGGWRHFFSEITDANAHQANHTRVGRLTFIPILLISVSAIYLSLEGFGILTSPDPPEMGAIDFDALNEEPLLELNVIPIFKEIKLDQFQVLNFPFSPDVEDFFELKTKSAIYQINQLTGEVVDKVEYPTIKSSSDLFYWLHTGKGAPYWAMILSLVSLGMVYFIISGVLIFLDRRKNTISNTCKSLDAEYHILVGSENGSTLAFAKILQGALNKVGKQAFVVEMNAFENIRKDIKNMVIFTSTYGIGEAPSNASKFVAMLDVDLSSISFAVLGFGSRSYIDFCKFAKDVDQSLSKVSQQTMPLSTVDNLTYDEFLTWVNLWAETQSLKLTLPPTAGALKRKTTKMRVEGIQFVNSTEDNTFIVKINKPRKPKIISGDLIGIFPPSQNRPRYYSIGISDEGKSIKIYVKKHEYGICSQFLSNLKTGDSIDGFLQQNTHFNLPKKFSAAILIANGTGIGPFLGMISGNKYQQPLDLYWGGHNEAAFDLFGDQLQQDKILGQVNEIKLAYSRSAGTKTYVQDLIAQDCKTIVEALNNGCIIMICGSLAMQKGVEQVLEEGSLKYCDLTLGYFRTQGQILVDCY